LRSADVNVETGNGPPIAGADRSSIKPPPCFAAARLKHDLGEFQEEIDRLCADA